MSREYRGVLLFSAAVLLSLAYFSMNNDKIVDFLRFQDELSRLTESHEIPNEGFASLSIEGDEGKAIVKRSFYSPFCWGSRLRFYVVRLDLVPFLGQSLRFQFNGRTADIDRIFLYPGFTAFVIPGTNAAVALIHGTVGLELARIASQSEELTEQILSPGDLESRQMLGEIAGPISVVYEQEEDREFVDADFPMPAVRSNQTYQFEFQYHSDREAVPYFIVGHDPDWPFHIRLQGTGSGFQRVSIAGKFDSDVQNPSIILRNWGGEGTVIFRDVKFYSIPHTYELSEPSVVYSSNLDLAVPKVISLKHSPQDDEEQRRP